MPPDGPPSTSRSHELAINTQFRTRAAGLLLFVACGDGPDASSGAGGTYVRTRSDGQVFTLVLGEDGGYTESIINPAGQVMQTRRGTYRVANDTLYQKEPGATVSMAALMRRDSIRFVQYTPPHVFVRQR